MVASSHPNWNGARCMHALVAISMNVCFFRPGFAFTAGKQCEDGATDFQNSCQNNCCKPKPFTGKYNCTCWVQDGNFCGTGYSFIDNGVCNV